METTKDRFKKVLDVLGIKPLGLASILPEVSKSALQALWTSKTGVMSTVILEPFCAHFKNVNCNYLLRGEGPMFLDGIENSAFNTITSNKYYEMCKLILENKRRETELYNRIADVIEE